MVEECNTEEQRSVVHFLWAKGLSAENVHKEMFHVYSGKCFSRKAVHSWAEKSSQGRSKVADDETETRKCLRQVKGLICCGFRRASKEIGRVYQFWWRICREITFFFFRFEYHVFYVLHL
jgi:hypothetical protein